VHFISDKIQTLPVPALSKHLLHVAKFAVVLRPLRLKLINNSTNFRQWPHRITWSGAASIDPPPTASSSKKLLWCVYSSPQMSGSNEYDGIFSLGEVEVKKSSRIGERHFFNLNRHHHKSLRNVMGLRNVRRFYLNKKKYRSILVFQ
jgi:hypothetical protein